MTRFNAAWLVVNRGSGSNSPDAVESLAACFAEHGIAIERRICFPEDSLPTADALDAAGIGLLAIYTGDGTINTTLRQLGDWSGTVLVLPGGTMNLLSGRLHGDSDNAEIIRLVAAGGGEPRRVATLRCEAGVAFADCLAGPGTQWAEVREAMREGDVLAMASGAAEAVAESLNAPGVRAAEPALGLREGYPLIELTPDDHGLGIKGYHAEGMGELAQHGWALLKRQFRDGPHDDLGTAREIVLESRDGSPLSLLLDGEAASAGAQVRFTVASSACDLLATRHG